MKIVWIIKKKSVIFRKKNIMYFWVSYCWHSLFFEAKLLFKTMTMATGELKGWSDGVSIRTCDCLFQTHLQCEFLSKICLFFPLGRAIFYNHKFEVPSETGFSFFTPRYCFPLVGSLSGLKENLEMICNYNMEKYMCTMLFVYLWEFS